MEVYRQLAVVLGPVIVTAILGPILLLLMGKAKNRAETENYEVLSDKTRLEAMDLLINQLRLEVARLIGEVAVERAAATTSRQRIVELENQMIDTDRVCADVGRWALSMSHVMQAAGLPVPERQMKIDTFLDKLE